MIFISLKTIVVVSHTISQLHILHFISFFITFILILHFFYTFFNFLNINGSNKKRPLTVIEGFVY